MTTEIKHLRARVAAYSRRLTTDAPERQSAKAELVEAVFTDRVVTLLQNPPQHLRVQRLNIITEAIEAFQSHFTEAGES